MRAPSLAEAEAADIELCREVSSLLAKNFTLDQAIHECVVVRNSLNMWLQPRPRLPGKGKGKGGKGKGHTALVDSKNGKQDRRGGKKEGSDGKFKGTCHAF